MIRLDLNGTLIAQFDDPKLAGGSGAFGLWVAPTVEVAVTRFAAAALP